MTILIFFWVIERERKYKQWEDAVQRSFGWTDVYRPADHI